MPPINDLTANLIRSLRKSGPAEQAKTEMKLRREARALSNNGEHAKAAAIYACLAEHHKDDVDLPLRAAHSYRLAGNTDQAAAWFLRAAEQYARIEAHAQAAATLRLYHELAPNEFEGPRRIFRMLTKKGQHDPALLKYLSEKDRAGYKLMSSDFFSSLDPQAFFALLDSMNIINLKDGDILTRMGGKGSCLYFVTSGTLEGFLVLNGKRISLGLLHAGDVCGEIAYFTGGRRTAEIVSRGPSSLLALPYEQLDALLASYPACKERLEALYRARMLVKQLSLAPLFSELDSDTREAIAEKMTPVKFKAGEIIFREGESSTDLYFVRRGKVTINLHAGGAEEPLKQIETGGVFGEMAIILNGKRSSTARAVSDCLLMRLSGEEYMRIYQGSAQLQRLLEKQKLEQLDETRRFIRNIHTIEGDDACLLLLQHLWRAQPAS